MDVAPSGSSFGALDYRPSSSKAAHFLLSKNSLRFEHTLAKPGLACANQENFIEVQQAREIKGWEDLDVKAQLAFLACIDGLPSIEDFICTLQKCRKEQSLSLANRAHAYAHGVGLGVFDEIGNFLVPMFVDCDNVHSAHQAFQRLLYPNEYSWTSLIHGYIGNGDLVYALNLFERMKSDCIRPSKYTFLVLLKACIRLQSMGRGLELHTEIVKAELFEDPFVGSTLVDMYAKCGFLTDARAVFDELTVRGVVAWTALISGYAEQGVLDEGLKCLDRMRLEGISPNDITFVCSLKACSITRSVNKGHLLHLDIVKHGYEENISVGNALVDLYVKVGLLVEAQRVFDMLPVRDVISWNALMVGHVDGGLTEEALFCLQLMEIEGVSPNAVTYVCGLKACGIMGDLDKGRRIHVEILKEEFERDSSVGSTLIDMYGKCSSVLEASEVFSELPSQGLASRTALIAAYAEQGLNEEAMNLLDGMQLEGVLHDAVVSVCALKVCGSTGALAMGLQIHSQLIQEGFESDLYVGSALVDFYVKCEFLVEAQDLFDELPGRDLATWSALIGGYAEIGFAKEALDLLDQMQLAGLFPDVVTFLCSLKACGSIGAVNKGRELHAMIAEEGLESDLFIGNTLVDMYVKCGVFLEACEIFDELPTRDVVSWNAVIVGCGDQGNFDRAVLLYIEMQEHGVLPDSMTYSSVLKACGSTAMLKLGKKIHAQVQVFDGDGSERIISIALIHMYGKSGSIAAAQLVFNTLVSRDLIQWTALIAGYACLGESEVVFLLFERMIADGIWPSGITLAILLSACCHAGLLHKGQQYFESMISEYSLTANLLHYNCIIDLFGRAGQVHKAMVVLEAMPFQPDLVTWNVMLSACRMWGSWELGKRVSQSMMSSCKMHPSALISMSNISPTAHIWDHAEIMRSVDKNMHQVRA